MLLRFKTMQQTIDDRSQVHQTRYFDRQPAAATKARRFVRGHVGPISGDHSAASVGEKQEKAKPLAAIKVTKHLEGLPLADMRLAGDPDRDRKVTEVGIVSGSPSTISGTRLSWKRWQAFRPGISTRDG